MLLNFLAIFAALAGKVCGGPVGNNTTSTDVIDTSAYAENTTAVSNFTSLYVADNTAPRFVVYWDHWVDGQNGPPNPSVFEGYNVVMLSFLLSWYPADQAAAWASLSYDERIAIKQRYNAAGIKLMVSAFGATDTPTTSGTDPTALAQWMAEWVKAYNLDGIDIDYEDFNAVWSGASVDWLSTFTQVLRDNLPQGEYFITHAPVAPWFCAAGGNSMVEVNNRVGGLIDWYNVQFYNQLDQYQNCESLIWSSGGTYPGSSVFEIANAGVDLNKIVVGKPASWDEATNGGYMDPGFLSSCLKQAADNGWRGGAMVWEYPTADSQWIKTVRDQWWAY
ncbi:glycoside hydrolase family 18 protein [Sphaerobolus stellatus SS14]|nr:glycoside hydrolase family 18 protein [Sphaerobolus stellatus SS14]